MTLAFELVDSVDCFPPPVSQTSSTFFLGDTIAQLQTRFSQSPWKLNLAICLITHQWKGSKSNASNINFALLALRKTG